MPKDDNPQYQQWNFSIQREVPGHGVVEANYVGTKGTHLFFGQGDVVSDLDPLAPTLLGHGQEHAHLAGAESVLWDHYESRVHLLQPADDPTQPPAAALRGVHECGRLSRVAQHRQLDLSCDDQFKYEKRFSQGLSVVAHYTISKMISDSDVSGSDVNFIAGDSSIQDYFNLRNERSLSAFDVPQRLVVSFDYQLPLGRGRTLGKSMNRVLDAVVGGWEVSGIISAASRTPLGITQSASTLWIGSQRPNQIGDPSVPGAVRDKLNNYFNVKAFSARSDRI